MNYAGEIAKTRETVLPYLQGHVLDLGSRGTPVVPWAIQFDLHRFDIPPNPPVQLVWSVETLPFKDATIDAVYSSHCLEDFYDWDPILLEWWRVVKPGGYLIIQVPDRIRYRAAVKAGQPDNSAHQHESFPEELSRYAKRLFGRHMVIADRYEPESDYNILFCCQKIS